MVFLRVKAPKKCNQLILVEGRILYPDKNRHVIHSNHEKSRLQGAQISNSSKSLSMQPSDLEELRFRSQGIDLDGHLASLARPKALVSPFAKLRKAGTTFPPACVKRMLSCDTPCIWKCINIIYGEKLLISVLADELSELFYDLIRDEFVFDTPRFLLFGRAASKIAGVGCG